MTTPVAAVVPTLGASPLLAEALAGLRRAGGATLELRLVAPRDAAIPEDVLADGTRVVRSGKRLGFAAAVNLGAQGVESDYLAVVNDDAIVDPGWLDELIAALDSSPRAAAAQGCNLSPEGTRIDGLGIAWNRFWQAIQRHHGEPLAPRDPSAAEVFGASATAALFRTRALQGLGGPPFDERLESYYEDVALAGALRAHGWIALFAPRARCLHSGSLTGATLGERRTELLYGNRLLVLAELFGRSFLRRLPRILAVDLRDLWRVASSRRRGILAGWRRAVRLYRFFRHSGPPLVPMAELCRFREP